MDPCPAPEILGAYAERHLAPSGAEAVESHLASCASCRGTAVHLARLRTPGLKARRGWLAAAAALVLAILLLRWDRADRPVASPFAPVAASESSPFPPMQGTLLLGQATSVSLKPGSRAETRSGDLSLLEGSAWVENPGEPCTILVPGGAVTAECARFLVEVLPGLKAASWIADAWASGPPGVRVWVETGSAVLRRESGETARLDAGTQGRLGPGVQGPSPSAPPPWRGEVGWRSLSLLPVRLRDARLALDSGGEPCVWETVLRRRDPAACVGVRFAAGGRCWEIPLGAALLEAPDRLRVRVEIRSGWVRIRSGGCEILQAPVRDLGRRLEPAQGEPGLRAWGGDVEVLEARWRSGT